MIVAPHKRVTSPMLDKRSRLMLTEVCDDLHNIAMAFERFGDFHAATEFLAMAEQLALESTGAAFREIPDSYLRPVRPRYGAVHSRSARLQSHTNEG